MSKGSSVAHLEKPGLAMPWLSPRVSPQPLAVDRRRHRRCRGLRVVAHAGGAHDRPGRERHGDGDHHPHELYRRRDVESGQRAGRGHRVVRPGGPHRTSSTLTVSVAAAVAPGVYNLTVDGTATPGNRSTPLTLTVNSSGGGSSF